MYLLDIDLKCTTHMIGVAVQPYCHSKLSTLLCTFDLCDEAYYSDLVTPGAQSSGVCDVNVGSLYPFPILYTYISTRVFAHGAFQGDISDVFIDERYVGAKDDTDWIWTYVHSTLFVDCC